MKKQPTYKWLESRCKSATKSELQNILGRLIRRCPDDLLESVFKDELEKDGQIVAVPENVQDIARAFQSIENFPKSKMVSVDEIWSIKLRSGKEGREIIVVHKDHGEFPLFQTECASKPKRRFKMPSISLPSIPSFKRKEVSA